MNKINGHVYLIENIDNGKRYIGAKSTPYVPIEDYAGSGVIIKEEIKRLGINKFVKICLVENIDNYDELNATEEDYIKTLKTTIEYGGYNIKENGGNCVDYSQKSRDKMSKSGKIKLFSEEHRNNISNANMGIKNGFHGKHHKPETNLKNAQSHSKFFIFMDKDNNIFRPLSYVKFCNDHNIVRTILYENIYERINESHIFIQTQNYELLKNTIGWCRFDKKYAINNNLIDKNTFEKFIFKSPDGIIYLSNRSGDFCLKHKIHNITLQKRLNKIVTIENLTGINKIERMFNTCGWSMFNNEEYIENWRFNNVL